MSGARLTRRGDARRTSLLDAAETVLVARGHADASLRAIADEAGVRIGHLQHYFPARADLVKAVLERALDRSLERLAAATGPRADAADAVAVLLAEQEDPRLVRLYVELWALAARDEDVAEVVRAFYGTYVGHVEAFLRRLRPERTAAFCRARAETFVALLEGAALLRSGIAGKRSGAVDAHLAEQAVRLLQDG
ncbi:TetR/AcrR family transcriptional regulator [Streptomyces caatingaensis]|uniref:TetR family transcriptional regulator n=1 Tax=Streptomyces caatingaensis TaxID=1678637 RepID=A0A0K9XKW4_9ACTN|nr:TetR/AcrR family transcriptional regulator [Streptomyces caatingaensis]KNB53990.1 TetR family transcriptional regulator [Streptomyces caatingaensis]